MKQVLQSIKDGQVTVVDLPAPKPAEGEILVRVSASLVSAGTERMVAEFSRKNLVEKARARPDLVRQTVEKARKEGLLTTYSAVRNRLDQPLGLGYSCAGFVVQCCEEESDLRSGDPVCCAGSGYAMHAQVVSVPLNLVARIPEPVQLEAAAFTTLGTIALHAVRLAGCKLGEVVGVIGLGVLGQLTVQILNAAGCRVVALDPRNVRAQLAGKLGAEEISSEPEAFKALALQLSDGRGLDTVLITADTSSSQPVELAAEVARDRAVVVAVGAVGTQLPRKLYYEKELEFRISRSYGPGRYDPEYENRGQDYPIGYVRWTQNRNMRAFLQLMAEDKVDALPLITHRFPVEQAAEAYALISGDEPSMGVLITFPEESDLSRKYPLKPAELGTSSRAPGADERRREARVGLIGTGAFASGVLLPAMRRVKGTRFVGACSARGISARHVGKKFDFSYCTTDEDEIFGDPAINTVVIATRHHLHWRQILKALGACKHVFCEKPPCLNEQELAAVVKAYLAGESVRRQLLFMVGYNRRFAPLSVRLKSCFSNSCGPLIMQYRVNGGSIPLEHWIQDPESGGGRIIGEVCHFVDLMTFLVGCLPVEVTARALPNQGRFKDDNLTAILSYENGSVGSVTYVADGDRTFSKERLEVFGQGTAAVLDDFRYLSITRSGRRKVFRRHLRQDKGHRGEWEDFTGRIQRPDSQVIPFEELVSTSLTTFRMLESIRTGQALAIGTREFISRASRMETDVEGTPEPESDS